MSAVNGTQVWTIYWNDGSREVVVGTTIEDVFIQNGWSDRAAEVHAIENGNTYSMVYDYVKKAWNKQPPLVLSYAEYQEKIKTVEDLVKLMEKHLAVTMRFDSKDEIAIYYQEGRYATIGDVYHLTVSGGEYSSDEEGDFYYAMQCEYFSPSDLIIAANAFIQRADPHLWYKSSGLGVSLDEIKLRADAQLTPA